MKNDLYVVDYDHSFIRPAFRLPEYFLPDHAMEFLSGYPALAKARNVELVRLQAEDRTHLRKVINGKPDHYRWMTTTHVLDASSDWSFDVGRLMDSYIIFEHYISGLIVWQGPLARICAWRDDQIDANVPWMRYQALFKTLRVYMLDEVQMAGLMPTMRRFESM